MARLSSVICRLYVVRSACIVAKRYVSGEKCFKFVIIFVSQPFTCKLWAMQCKKYIFIFGVKWIGVEEMRFLMENWSYVYFKNDEG